MSAPDRTSSRKLPATLSLTLSLSLPLTLTFSALAPLPTLPAQESKPQDPLLREERFHSGSIKARWRVDENGNKNGAFLAWHENGLLQERAWYASGVLDGLHELFHQNGKLALSEVKKAGITDGKSSERNENGTHEVRFPFVKGKLHGRVEILDKGKITGTQEWKDGSLITIDGFIAHPKPKDGIKSALASIYGPDDPSGDAVGDTPTGALQVLKAYRYLCDVPWTDLELDPQLNAHAAAAASLCKRIGHLDHTPQNPGMPESEYRFAFTGTSSSNLSVGSNLPGSVHSYMNDSDPSNIDRVGHRRWCLNPGMKRTGFGKDEAYSAMWSFDESRTKIPDFEAICYPPRGYLPVRYFGPGHAFSVQLNPNKYRAPDITSTEITVTPPDERYLRSGPPLAIENEKAQNSGFGVRYCLIFRPRGIVVAPGARYLVEIKFVKEKPARQSLRWLVEFY